MLYYSHINMFRGLRSEECSSSNALISLSAVNLSTRRSESSLFSLTSEDEEDAPFDTTDSDDNREVLMAGKRFPSIQEFASAIPNHLLLGSLLEHLCLVYESNPARSRMLFKAIGQRLAAMNLLSPLAISDEFSTVRLQHNRAFTELLHAASSSLFPQVTGQGQHLTTDAQSLAGRPKEGLFQAQTSRYLSEFEEICRLGKGSFGNVFKVKNKLDGQDYAVKKVLIKNVSRDDCMKVLQEAKVLSGLQHVNIVGYHTAWMEHVQPTAYPRSSLPALDAPAQQDSSDESADYSSTGSSIIFESSSPAEPLRAVLSQQEKGQALCPKTTRLVPDTYVPCVFLGQRGLVKNSKCPAMSLDGPELLEDDSSKRSVELNNNTSINLEMQQWADKEVQFHLMLYIQMQLCERSLKDWISERNALPKDQHAVRCPYGRVDAERTLSLLRKILEGVEYIHSRGIMHRDLKPRNIFLHGQDCHVRIGDFGLACRNIILDGHESSTSTSHGSTPCPTHTTGVGTFVYAAPEQLEGSNYDSKSDMYSVGVLALELFQPFETEMERVQTLGHLREGKIPDSFSHRWPVLAQYIMKLTSKDPSVRPNATQLLQSQLFSSKDMVIHVLQRKVEEQAEEINLLRKRLSQFQSSLNSPHLSECDNTSTQQTDKT